MGLLQRIKKIAPDQTRQPVYVGVYKTPLSNGIAYARYEFRLSKDPNAFHSPAPRYSPDPIQVKKLPGQFQKEAQQWMEKRKLWMPEIGNIRYHLFQEKMGRVPMSDGYYPKDNAGESRFKGLPYFLEALCVTDLKRSGFTHVMTSAKPGPSRENQLTLVGLPVRTPTPIRDWLLGMGRGLNPKTVTVLREKRRRDWFGEKPR